MPGNDTAMPAESQAEKTMNLRALKGVKAIFERYHKIANATNFDGFDKAVMSGLQLIAASHTPGAVPISSCTYNLHITPAYANLNGVMHGGAAGVIFDMATTTALGPLARPGFWDFMGGVSRCINISYLRAVPVGTTVRIHSEVLQAGKTTAMIRGTMTNLDESVIYCTAEHQKVAVPSQKGHLTKEYEVEWDREMAEEAAKAMKPQSKL